MWAHEKSAAASCSSTISPESLRIPKSESRPFSRSLRRMIPKVLVEPPVAIAGCPEKGLLLVGDLGAKPDPKRLSWRILQRGC